MLKGVDVKKFATIKTSMEGILLFNFCLFIVCEKTQHGAHADVRGQLAGTGSLLPPQIS